MKLKAGDLSPHAFLRSHRSYHKELSRDRISILDCYLDFLKRSPSPSFAEVEDSAASRPMHGRILQTSRRSCNLGFRGRVNGAVLTGQKCSRNFHAVGVDTMNSMDGMTSKDVASSFNEWFMSQTHGLFDKLFRILQGVSNRHSPSADFALSQLQLRLNEPFVLDVLRYGRSKDVLSCLVFFDWAGRQPGFHHTRSTFNAIFKILSKAKLKTFMLDFLGNYEEQRFIHHVRFYDTLIMGYAIAGRPDFAFEIFGKMRFQGLDLDSFAYHVLLNALVEENCFDKIELISEQISSRGYVSHITHSILLKTLCKKNKLDEAEIFLDDLVNSGQQLNGHNLSGVVEALCKNGNFEQAGKLIEKFRDIELFPMERAYGVWITNLARTGKLNMAMDFLHHKKSLEGYIPDVFRCNILLYKLLRENRLQDVCDLLTEMMEKRVSPDKETFSVALCFFCKAEMVDVALDLYNSRIEYGLSPNSMAYNYLINTLCGDGSTDEAYHVLKNSSDQGYFPDKKTFSILAEALCRDGKLETMKELMLFALEKNCMPSNSTYDKFVSALCKGNRVEDGYLIHEELSRINKVAKKYTYYNLIYGFNRSRRGDIAAMLIVEMQEKGHQLDHKLFRAVIRSLSEMENFELRFLNLLDLQLTRCGHNCQVYNMFIDGAGHVKKTDLAMKVFDMMLINGVEPNLRSYITMLNSYLLGERIYNALTFFNDLHLRQKVGVRLYSAMVVGLCNANKVDLALDYLKQVRSSGAIPSAQCYEALVKVLCEGRNYDMVINLINDMQKAGRPITSFIGNVLLLHSLKSQVLYETWIGSMEVESDTSLCSMLGFVIGTFSGCISVGHTIEILEEAIEYCFPLNLYTYNMLLRRQCMRNLDRAFELFNRMCKKGYEPNRWTYDILVHGLFRHGRTTEAHRWLEKMYRKGFAPTKGTMAFI